MPYAGYCQCEPALGVAPFLAVSKFTISLVPAIVGIRAGGKRRTTKVSTGSNEGLLLEPVNEKKDGYGFVYAPMRNSNDVYNPFKSASAYQK